MKYGFFIMSRAKKQFVLLLRFFSKNNLLRSNSISEATFKKCFCFKNFTQISFRVNKNQDLSQDLSNGFQENCKTPFFFFFFL